jgi:hypothetical protein
MALFNIGCSPLSTIVSDADRDIMGDSSRSLMQPI